SGSNTDTGWLKLWEVATGRLLWSGRHGSGVNRLSFSTDGSALVGAVGELGVIVWDAASGTLLQTLPHPNSIAGVAWSPDGHLLATGDVRGCVRLWAMDQSGLADQLHEQPVHTLALHTSCADGLAFAPDGRFLASASWDGTVKLWEVASGRLLR